MVEELLPKGRALVPTKIKEDLLARIKTYLENDSDYKRLTGYWEINVQSVYHWSKYDINLKHVCMHNIHCEIKSLI